MKKEPHSYNSRVLNWTRCSKCGLVLLKNDATKKLARKECPDDLWRAG